MQFPDLEDTTSYFRTHGIFGPHFVTTATRG